MQFRQIYVVCAETYLVIVQSPGYVYKEIKKAMQHYFSQ